MEWADASFDIHNVHETKKTNITQPELKPENKNNIYILWSDIIQESVSMQCLHRWDNIHVNHYYTIVIDSSRKFLY
jgi:hypothetical protein